MAVDENCASWYSSGARLCEPQHANAHISRYSRAEPIAPQGRRTPGRFAHSIGQRATRQRLGLPWPSTAFHCGPAAVSRSHAGMFETLPSNSNAFQAAKPLRVTDLTDQLCSAEVLLCARNRIFLSLSSSKKEKRAGERRRFSSIPPSLRLSPRSFLAGRERQNSASVLRSEQNWSQPRAPLYAVSRPATKRRSNRPNNHKLRLSMAERKLALDRCERSPDLARARQAGNLRVTGEMHDLLLSSAHHHGLAGFASGRASVRVLPAARRRGPRGGTVRVHPHDRPLVRLCRSRLSAVRR